ncbi:TonB-dependent receptor [Ideonella dechloratans]|uniref:TonB-dependent receptor n=1 Tax=Ideonella dechloratans TaxID=36863 RepID=A0A643F922_IDEDE|nr:TonB-dependent receptor [Ideonella dechloratans]KAB0576721.1 TonB-dependent receptor [Ideonella dechloratans]UFU10371.1 TonB-dependent receptor [Ideonella dechloratans]
MPRLVTPPPPLASRRGGRRPFRWTTLAALAALAGAAQAQTATAPPDLTQVPLEQLLDTEVVGAARFARQITDAASAVSVLTAQDIQALGLRTLGEVLDQMRGLHLTTDLDYVYLGARGIGGPGAYAGRVLMLVDGIAAVDNLFDQVFLGQDGLLDPALIERIEYAPGAGSAMYGNNAFLGVINIVTRRGRDLDGVEAAVAAGSNQDRQARLSAGRRLADNREWLASVTMRRNDSVPTSEVGHLPIPGQADALSYFFKGQWEDFDLQALGSRRSVQRHYPWDPADDRHTDGGDVLALGHQHAWDNGWQTLLRAQWGAQKYDYTLDWPGAGDYEGRIRSNGRWWSLEGQAGYAGWTDHRLALGLRLRADPVLRYREQDNQGLFAQDGMRRKSVSVSAEDEWRLAPDWRLTLGLRGDRRSHVDWTASPHAALVWWATPDWQIKASVGRATRFASAAEEGFGTAPQTHGERALHRELSTEYRHDDLRLLASVYRSSVRQLIWPDPQIDRLSSHGLELEGEWQWQGLRLRASQVVQHSSNNLGEGLRYAPRHIGKLQLSVPLGSERWRLSSAVRHTGAYLGAAGTRVPTSTRIDLTLLGLKAVAGLDLTVGWRNAGNSPEHTLDGYYSTPPDPARRARYAWVGLQGSFR